MNQGKNFVIKYSMTILGNKLSFMRANFMVTSIGKKINVQLIDNTGDGIKRRLSEEMFDEIITVVENSSDLRASKWVIVDSLADSLLIEDEIKEELKSTLIFELNKYMEKQHRNYEHSMNLLSGKSE